MKLDVTRDVVSDLWPLYSSGEASEDTRTLVEGFLAQDSGFRAVLDEAERVQGGVPAFRLSLEGERRLIAQAHERARMKMWTIGVAIGVSGLVALVALAGALFVVFGR